MLSECGPNALGVFTGKVCSKCGEWKPCDQFNLLRSGPDGLQPKCRACEAARYIADKGAFQERGREWRAKHKDHLHAKREANKEENAAYQRKYRQEHRGELIASSRERSRAYYAANRDAIHQKRREAYLANPDKAIAQSRSRLLKLKVSGRITADDIAAIRKAQTDKKGRLICWRCHKPIKDTPHLDHFIPIKLGGSHTPGNLHFMHATCNLNKHAKHPFELGMLI